MQHTRDMVRHHRERMIARRIRDYQMWFRWVPEYGLSKAAIHSHHCDWCTIPYKRTNYNWRHDPEVLDLQ